ncbi:uncharacterized protein CIMG_11090 [Coccidioides immitis RS]|uniref:Uncharacterized protein n=1 Tax=Coccidioides immitis (strain RS) TaxID=246410 RepID=A0A0D8JX15_COCIM|nr:uncharacterized protein CIMG_11090 [Coccidioides immitis RS]KJF61481.1 hypothetical protein CIMG_11090 [Coccidioides immitis RS]
MATGSTVLDHFHILQRAGGSGSLRYRLSRMQEMETMIQSEVMTAVELSLEGLRRSFFINQGVYLCNKPNEICKIITPPSAAIFKHLENLHSTVPKCQHTKGMSTAKNPNTGKN